MNAPTTNTVAAGSTPHPSSGECREAICEAASEVCRSRFGSRLRALILTGSMAREEATFWHTGAGSEVAGDAEFLLIFHTASELPPYAEVAAAQLQVERELALRRVRCSISMSAGHERYLRSLGPRIFTYELRACGKVLWGDQEILAAIPEFAAEAVAREDAWRMLSNRIVEQCEAISRAGCIEGTLTPEICYAGIKLYLDMATSLLVFAGRYAPTYRERNQRLSQLPSDTCHAWPFDLEGFSRKVELCTRWKLEPDQRPSGVPLSFWLEAAEDARRLWLWETAWLTGADQPGAAAAHFRRMAARTQPLGNRVRGWLYVVRKQGWHRSWRSWPRWTLQMLQGSPRANIYSAACELFFQLPSLVGAASGTTESLPESAIENRLPLVSGDPNGTRWQRLAREITWNYKMFVTETTA